MNKYLKHIILLIIVFFLVFVYFFEPECIFLRLFSIPCMSCGLTRAFNSILCGDLLGAIKYNILSIPLFITLLVFLFFYILDIFFRKKYLDAFINFFIVHYKIILFILLISWIYNLILYII